MVNFVLLPKRRSFVNLQHNKFGAFVANQSIQLLKQISLSANTEGVGKF